MVQISYFYTYIYTISYIYKSVFCFIYKRWLICFFYSANSLRWTLLGPEILSTLRDALFGEVLLVLARNTEKSYLKNRRPFRHTHNTVYPSLIAKEKSLKTIRPEEINFYWFSLFCQRLFCTIFCVGYKNTKIWWDWKW